MKKKCLTSHKATAILGFVVLMFSKFPPEGSERLIDEPTEETAEDI